MSSNAVTLDRIARVVGYKITKGFFNLTSPNLPQRIAMLGEANDANQSGLVTNQPTQITTAQQAGSLFGYGSPIHMMARILFPYNGDGIGGIPVWVYPQSVAPGATAKIWRIQPTGVATANVTHYLKIAGRESIDNNYYAINIVVGDTTPTILQKIVNAVNGILGSPFSANQDSYEAILTSKWSGLTADALTVSVDTGTNAAGVTYAVNSPQSGSATPSIAAALNLFQNDWNTIVVNPYGTDTGTIQSLMAFNGIPDPTNPTGRFTGIIFKPFIAITGSTADDPSSVTNTYLNDVTIAIAPAPGSLGLSLEAAANMTYLAALQFQNSVNLDVSGQFYPDMPVPTPASWAAATMAVYTNRDALVKKGCSTVNLTNNQFKVEDFVTTYHPQGENPAQYRYPRNLNIDNNVKFGYHLLEALYVQDHSIANDSDTVTADNVIKPKEWTGILNEYANDLATRALITNPDFMKASIVVNIGTTNPDRLETFFRYQRSGFARIASTTAEAGFFFGS